jgi:hypothetical protein
LLNEIKQLYDDLMDRIKTKNISSCYEYNDTKELDYMRPFIDIDLEVKKLSQDDSNVIETTIKTLKKLFGDDANIIYSTDHRNYIKKGEKKRKSKQSFHFIVANKKIKPQLLNKYMKQNSDEFTYKIDMRVYRDGISKFRLPLTRKENDQRTNEKKYMNINGGNSLENFTKFCLSYTEGLTEFIPTIREEQEEEKKEIECDENNVLDQIEFIKLFNEDIEPVLKHFNIKKTIYQKEKTQIIYCLEGNNNCGKNHTNNHQYLRMDLLENSLWLCCHSEDCNDKLIYDNVFMELKEFSLSTFLRLPNDYYKLKKYFEKRIIYLSDTGHYKQIKYDKNNEVRLEDISYNKISEIECCYYKKNGKMEISTFGSCYQKDKYRKMYKDTIFYPNKKLDRRHTHYYNEFRGLGYERIIPEYINKNKIYEEYKEKINFYIDFVLKYICEDNKKVLHYFLSLISSYVKYPERLTHMILVLYSNQQGTGKSSLGNFIFKIIGMGYCVSAEMEQITEKHSNLSYKKIINLVEELEYDKSKNNAKVLKNKCQAETLTLNEKCEKMRVIDNYTHFIITTNNHKSMPLPQGDRRHFVVEPKKIYDNKELIDEIEKLYSDINFIYSFGRYLKEYKEEWDFTSPKEWEINRKGRETKIFNLMIKKNGLEKFFTSLIDYDYHKDKNVKDEFYYEKYINENLEDFILENDEIRINKGNLYDLYIKLNDNDIKITEKNFYEKCEKIYRFCNVIVDDGEQFYILDMNKLKNHLRLRKEDVKLPKILKAMRQTSNNNKRVREEINDILIN